MRRLFFALWPDEAVRDELAALVSQLPLRGRRVPRSNWHMTLLFLGACDEMALAAARDAAARVIFPPFEVTLDRLGHFSRVGATWVGPESTPDALQRLVSDLRSQLSTVGVLPGTASPFRAHVTLARKAAPPPEGAHCPPIRWPVRRFALMESVGGPNGVAYDVLAAWAAQDAVRFSGSESV